MKNKPKFTIGIDEAGRGPIAGPVAVGAFLIPETTKLTQLKKILKDETGPYPYKDSKKLSEKKREEVFRMLQTLRQQKKIDFAFSMVSAAVIDEKGISFSIKKALSDSLRKLTKNSLHHLFGKKGIIATSDIQVFLDGSLRAPSEFENQETFIKGDQRKLCIACASIVAKVTRDQYMQNLAKKFPGYLWDQNKGYGTRGHYKGIQKLGITGFHRKSFLKG
jgi:ribonuclease HII